ncbi:MAG: hypothetical protein RR565_08975 [Erysipelothrix sp.]
MKLMNSIIIENKFLKVEILPQGATVKSMIWKDKNRNIIASYESESDYVKNEVYLGTCIGPLAGRVKDNTVVIANQKYRLKTNNNTSHLHGGDNGLNHVIFKVKERDDVRVLLEGIGLHQIDGYPGNVMYEIEYRLVEHKMVLKLEASVTESMPLNLTNHMYFRLNNQGNLEKHQIKVPSKIVFGLNENMVNEGLELEKDGVFNLDESRDVERLLKMKHPQFNLTGHIDHTFLLDSNEMVLQSDDLKMTVRTDYPAIHLYFANYWNQSFKDSLGKMSSNHEAVAIEPQIPAPWVLNNSKYIINPGDTYSHVIEYELENI